MVRFVCFLLIYCIIPDVELLPEIQTIKGNVNKKYDLVINNTKEFVIYYNQITARNPFRILISTQSGDIEHPILVVVRQSKEVFSWEVPIAIENARTNEITFYDKTSTTLCHNNMEQINEMNFKGFMGISFEQEFNIALSSSCVQNVKIHIETIEEEKFYVRDNEEVSLLVSPSQSRYVFYKFNEDDSDTVTIDINSNDDVCLIVSIQDSRCPVFDQIKDIKFTGKFQSITKKGGLTIEKKDFSGGFFLVFVVQPDDYDCTEGRSDFFLFPRNLHADVTSNVSFVIRSSLDRKEYIKATFITIGTIIIFYLIALALILIFRKYGNIRHVQDESDNITIDQSVVDDALPRNSLDIKNVLENGQLTVKVLTKYPAKDKTRSFNYLWHIISIALFYSIPVVQLVITYQRKVNSTGDEDLCYYNFLCAHPLFGFSDFNHIFSNIGYLFMGLLFLCATLHRHSMIPFSFEVGIPVHYGLYYSMGVAIIIEGLLSACYHICPSQSNYQFDTSFMYIIAVLCMIKLYQNRHPDINATAYATFSVIGFGIFMATLGILNGSLFIWLLFSFGYTILCFYISFKIYFLSFVLQGFEKVKRDVFKNGVSKHDFLPTKRGRFSILLVANIINISILLIGLSLYEHNLTDFGTFLLGLLMANAVLYMLFYITMKLINKERICIEALVYFIFAIITWVFATIFFLQPATLWTVTPAESRQYNQDCILLNYYDKHDIWHLLSAPALYFTFMFLMCLDDDLINKRQDEIPVF